MLSLDLRDKIARYISSEISLEELENWLVQNLPNLASDPQSDDTSLAAAVDLCLAEFSEGLRSEDNIKQYLRDALNELNTVYIYYITGDYAPIMSSSSTSERLQTSIAIGTSELSTQFWLESGHNVFVKG